MDPIAQQPAGRWQAEGGAEGIEPAADDGIDEKPVGEGPLERAEPMRAAVDKDPGHSWGVIEAAKQHRRKVRGDQRHAEALLGDAGPEGEARGDDDRDRAGGGVGSERPLDHAVNRLEEGANKELEDHRSTAEWVPDPFVLDRRDEVELGERVNKLEARLLGHFAKPPGSDQRDADPATAQFPADPDEGMDIARASQGDEDGVRFLPGKRHGRGQKGGGYFAGGGRCEAAGVAKQRPLPSCPVAGNPSPAAPRVNRFRPLTSVKKSRSTRALQGCEAGGTGQRGSGGQLSGGKMTIVCGALACGRRSGLARGA